MYQKHGVHEFINGIIRKQNQFVKHIIHLFDVLFWEIERLNDLFSFVYVPIEFWSFDQPYISTENGLKVGLRGYIYFGAKKWLKYGYLDIIKSYIIMMSQPNFGGNLHGWTFFWYRNTFRFRGNAPRLRQGRCPLDPRIKGRCPQSHVYIS